MTRGEATDIIRRLNDEVSICFHWLNEFEILFPQDKLHYELYNATAPNFFQKINRLFFEFFFMSISKLLDPAKMNRGKNENLSLFQLVEIAKSLFPSMKGDIVEKINQIKLESKTILNARRKLYAHNDLNIKLNGSSIGGTSIEEIRTIIEEMQKVIIYISEMLEDRVSSPIWLTDQYGSRALLDILQKGMYYRELLKDHDLRKIIFKKEEDQKYSKLK